MLNHKIIFKFFIKVIIFYFILLLPFSFIDKSYGSFYRSICGKFFKTVAGTGFVWFAPTNSCHITKISIGNHKLDKPNGTTDIRYTENNTRSFAYLPTAMLLALIFASPVSIKRRLIAVLFGLIIITLFILLKQYIHIIEVCQQYTWLKLYEFSESGRNIIYVLFFGLCNTLTPSLIVVVLIWFLLTFRKGDLKQLLVKV